MLANRRWNELTFHQLVSNSCKHAAEAHMSASPQKTAEILPLDQQSRALEGFFQIMNRWHVGNTEARFILGNPPERTFFDWKKGKVGRVPNDTLRRIGYVAGIWKALQIVYSDPSIADSWVNRSNSALGGQTPLQRMSAGDVTDLAVVRAYIDAARAPWS
jgi:Protein of unknown function (DUF2384)